MGRRRKRIVARRLKERREAAQMAANPILSQENSVAQEALREAIKPPEITLSVESPEETTIVEAQATPPPRKTTKRTTRKTVAKKATPRRATKRRTKTTTQINSSK